LEHIQTPKILETNKESESEETYLDNYMVLKVTSLSDSQEIEAIMNDIRNTDINILSGIRYGYYPIYLSTESLNILSGYITAY